MIHKPFFLLFFQLHVHCFEYFLHLIGCLLWVGIGICQMHFCYDLNKLLFFHCLRNSQSVNSFRKLLVVQQSSTQFFKFYFHLYFTDGKESIKDASASKLMNARGPTGNVYINDHEKRQHRRSQHQPSVHRKNNLFWFRQERECMKKDSFESTLRCAGRISSKCQLQ